MKSILAAAVLASRADNVPAAEVSGSISFGSDDDDSKKEITVSCSP